jgi:hypothetical protein
MFCLEASLFLNLMQGIRTDPSASCRKPNALDRQSILVGACGFNRLREIHRVPEKPRLMVRIKRALRLQDVPPLVRRVIVAVIGGTVLLIGIALMVLPGPAFLVIPLGLAILATEFVWARRWLKKARAFVTIGNNRKNPPAGPTTD